MAAVLAVAVEVAISAECWLVTNSLPLDVLDGPITNDGDWMRR